MSALEPVQATMLPREAASVMVGQAVAELFEMYGKQPERHHQAPVSRHRLALRRAD